MVMRLNSTDRTLLQELVRTNKERAINIEDKLAVNDVNDLDGDEITFLKNIILGSFCMFGIAREYDQERTAVETFEDIAKLREVLSEHKARIIDIEDKFAKNTIWELGEDQIIFLREHIVAAALLDEFDPERGHEPTPKGIILEDLIDTLRKFLEK